MFDYIKEKNYYIVTLNNEKKVKISSKFVDTSINKLNISEHDVIEMWLDDEGYLNNEEQDTLDKQAKGQVKLVAKSEKPKEKKTQRERVAKTNPDKEYIINALSEYLKILNMNNINIENKGKLITFTYNDKDFKLDLVEKRKNKSEVK